MKNYTRKLGYLLFILPVFILLNTGISFGQMKTKVYFYTKIMPGYGNIFDAFDVTTPGQYGPVTARHRQSHGNGLSMDFAVGGTISKSKNVSKYSHLDVFALHRQLFASETYFRFSGGGIQGRTPLLHANVVLGVVSSGEEIPNRRNEQRIIGYGNLRKLAYGFGFGLNLPWEPRSKLIFIWEANVLFPRSQFDDLTGFLHYTWFSTNLGVKYYLSRIK